MSKCNADCAVCGKAFLMDLDAQYTQFCSQECHKIDIENRNKPAIQSKLLVDAFVKGFLEKCEKELAAHEQIHLIGTEYIIEIKRKGN